MDAGSCFVEVVAPGNVSVNLSIRPLNGNVSLDQTYFVFDRFVRTAQFLITTSKFLYASDDPIIVRMAYTIENSVPGTFVAPPNGLFVVVPAVSFLVPLWKSRPIPWKGKMDFGITIVNFPVGNITLRLDGTDMDISPAILVFQSGFDAAATRRFTITPSEDSLSPTRRIDIFTSAPDDGCSVDEPTHTEYVYVSVPVDPDHPNNPHVARDAKIAAFRVGTFVSYAVYAILLVQASDVLSHHLIGFQSGTFIAITVHVFAVLFDWLWLDVARRHHASTIFPPALILYFLSLIANSVCSYIIIKAELQQSAELNAWLAAIPRWKLLPFVPLWCHNVDALLLHRLHFFSGSMFQAPLPVSLEKRISLYALGCSTLLLRLPFFAMQMASAAQRSGMEGTAAIAICTGLSLLMYRVVYVGALYGFETFNRWKASKRGALPLRELYRSLSEGANRNDDLGGLSREDLYQELIEPSLPGALAVRAGGDDDHDDEHGAPRAVFRSFSAPQGYARVVKQENTDAGVRSSHVSTGQEAALSRGSVAAAGDS